jgi:hypothetical protein
LYCRWLAAILLHLFASGGRCNLRELEGLLLSLFPTAVTRIWTLLRSAQRKTVLRRFLLVFSKLNLHFYLQCWKLSPLVGNYNLHFDLECWKLSLIVGNFKPLVCFEGCEICVLRCPRCLCVMLSLVDCEWCTLPFHPYSNAVHPEVSLRFRVLDNSLFEVLVKRFHQEVARRFPLLEVLRLEIRRNIGHPQVSGAGRPSF